MTAPDPFSAPEATSWSAPALPTQAFAPATVGGDVVLTAGGATVHLASLGKRFGGLLLGLLLAVVTLGIGYLIWAIVLWQRGQTPAKQLLHMHVVMASTGQRATAGRMFLRALVAFVLGFIPLFGLVDGLATFFGAERARLVDRIVGTLVAEGDPAPH